MANLKVTCLALVASAAAACTAEPGGLELVEPELTAAEIALLPPSPDPEHTEATLVAGPAEDDAARFDDDAVTVPVDVDVVVDDAPTAPVIEAPAGAALLAWGLHPRASDALRAAGVSAWRITRTIGNDPSSAGYHLQDGPVNGHPRIPACDWSRRARVCRI